MSNDNSMTIDGRSVSFEEGQTIMDAALLAGHYIPHLCHHPDLEPHGNCRVCTVKVKGRHTYACITPAAEGLKILSDTQEINGLRRTLVQMLFVEGNHICPSCEKSGHCQLQAVASHVGMLTPRFNHFFPHRPVDASHPELLIDYDRCILCGLCVRASRDIDGKNLFAMGGHGIQSYLVVNTPSGKLGDTDFAVHDKAAQVCPVGAILVKHRGYEHPIGKRRYDARLISDLGDAVATEQKGATYE